MPELAPVMSTVFPSRRLVLKIDMMSTVRESRETSPRDLNVDARRYGGQPRLQLTTDERKQQSRSRRAGVIVPGPFARTGMQSTAPGGF
jgi:hypothetical protein